MLWIAAIYLIAQVAIFIALGVRLKRKDWAVLSVLWLISLAMSIIVRFHLWPDFEPLGWVRVLFEPPTQWILKRV